MTIDTVPTIDAPDVRAASPKRTWLTIPEAAFHAGVSQSTILRWCRLYSLLGRRVGGRWRLDPGVLEALLEGQGADHAR